MDLLEREARETARDYAIRVLQHNIITLALEPGCMVSENELSQRLGLSRTPIREALIELSKSGIVAIYPQHGSMISKIDYDLVDEASFTRRVLETAVVREVCSRADDGQIRDLEDNLSLQNLYLERGDSEKLMTVDNDFHRQLFIIARKRISYDLMRALSAHFDRVRRLSLVVLREIRIVADHQAILDAVRERNADKAAEAMQQHLTRYQLDRAAIKEKYSQYFV